MKIEEAKALFFDANALREPAYRVRKIEQSSMRFYAAYNPITGAYLKTAKGSIFFQSVTTFIKNSQPMPIGLLKWMCDKGYDKAKEESQQAADYGTLMHACFAEFLIGKSFDMEQVETKVLITITEKGYGKELLPVWTESLSSDMLAFAQWCADYEVEPLAIEVVLISPTLGIAGCLDLFCRLNDKCYTEKTAPDKRKKILGIVDFKSGRKGLYDDYEVQLEAYKNLWKENFPDDLQAEAIFNWAPTDWRKSPNYNFKNQTGSINTDLLKHFISIAEIKGEGRTPSFTEYKGNLTLGKAPADNFVFLGEQEIQKMLFGEEVKSEL